MDRLEEAEKAVERLNSFIVDEKIKNNSAMPLYNKAVETHSKEDILNAIEAVEQLEEGHMYKQALTNAVNLMAEVYNVKKEENEEEIDKKVQEQNLEAAEKAVERLNSFIVDEKIKNNSAMPLYNKAVETHSKEDILNAIEAVEQLEEGHMYKQALTNAVNLMAEVYANEKSNISNSSNLENNHQTNADNDISNQEIVIEQEPVLENNKEILNQQLLSEKQKLIMQLRLLEKYEKGEVNTDNTKTESFEKRISNLETQITQLKLKESDIVSVDPATALANSRNTLEELIVEREMIASKEEMQAIQSYRNAASLPTIDNIIIALKNASTLSEESNIKKSLIDTVIKIQNAYIKDEDEQKLAIDTMNELNIKPSEIASTNNFENEIANLVNQIKNIEYEEKIRTKNAEKLKVNINKKIAEIDAKIEGKNYSDNSVDTEIIELQNKDVKNKTSNIEEEVPPAFAEENDSKNIFNQLTSKLNKIVENKKIKNEQEQNELEKRNAEIIEYSNKLHQIAEEGRIFSDENRVASENDWMEQKTAQSLNKYNNDEMNDFALDKNMSEKEELPPTFADEKEDKFKIPHPIKAIKKVSKTLLEKINNLKFKEKITHVLEYMKKAKVAVVTAAIIIGLGTISSMNNEKVEAQTISSQETKANEENTVTNTNDVKKDNQIKTEENQFTVIDNTENQMNEDSSNIDFNNALQQKINDILNGETGVYTSSDKAISNTDMKMPSTSQRENSWTMVEPSVFYDVNGNVISEEDAVNKVENGEQIAARMDNDRGTAGYISIGQDTQENTQGLTR